MEDGHWSLVTGQLSAGQRPAGQLLIRHSKMLRRVLFAAGETGGHVYIAAALAKRLKEGRPQTQILFTGSKGRMERRILSSLGFPLETIDIGGLKRVGTTEVFRTLLQLPLSLLQSRRIIRQFSPSVITGVGGHSSGPVVLAGKLLGIPTLLIEPNVAPGLANRLLRHWIDGAAVAFPETARWFGSKARVTGTPVREEFYKIEAPISTRESLKVLIFGGSQGSRAINRLVCGALSFLNPERVSIVHQSGADDLERVEECYSKAGWDAEVLDFILDMPSYFAHSDLIISRSGASTVAELAAAGRPAILIPFPQASDDHQRRNAMALAQRGAAVLLDQQKTSSQDLARLLLDLEKDRSSLHQMGKTAKALAQPDSVDKMIRFMEEVAN